MLRADAAAISVVTLTWLLTTQHGEGFLPVKLHDANVMRSGQ